MNDQPDPGQTSELSHLLGVLSEARWLIAGIAGTVLVLGVLYSFLKPPVYQSDTVLRVLKQKAGGLSGLEALSSVLQGSSLPTHTEIELLQTRAVLVPVVHELHLNIRVGSRSFPILGALWGVKKKQAVQVSLFRVPRPLQRHRFRIIALQSGAYRLLSPGGRLVLQGKTGLREKAMITRKGKRVGLVRVKIDKLSLGVGQGTAITQIPMQKVLSDLHQELHVSEEGKETGIIKVAMQGGSPTEIARILNAVAAANVRANGLQSATQAADQLHFLTREMPRLKFRLLSAQKKLAAFLQTHATLAVSYKTRYLENRASKLQNEIALLHGQLAETSTVLGPENPERSALEEQLKSLKELRSSLIGDIAGLPQSTERLVRLEQKVRIRKDLYEGLVKEKQKLKLTEAGSVGGVVIVDRATVPSVPVGLRKGADAALSLLLGLVLGVLAAFTRRALRLGVESPELIERLGLPILTVIPHSTDQRRLMAERGRQGPSAHPKLLTSMHPEDLATEAFRSLRTSIQTLFLGSLPPIIGVTSLAPAEGKTFVTGNLGYILSKFADQLPVLVMDADLRRGSLHASFGVNRTPGLSDVLAGRTSFEKAVHTFDEGRLQVLTTGTIPEDPLVLFAKTDLEALMAKLKNSFSFIIVELPPILAVSDTFLLGPHMSHVLLVVRHGRHSLAQLRHGLSSAKRHGIRFEGCVLNDLGLASKRYAYREFGYQYRYPYEKR